MNKSTYGIPARSKLKVRNRGKDAIAEQTSALTMAATSEYGRAANEFPIVVSVLQYLGKTMIEFPNVATYPESMLSYWFPTEGEVYDPLSTNTFLYGLTRDGVWEQFELDVAGEVIQKGITGGIYHFSDDRLEMYMHFSGDATKYTRFRVAVFDNTTALTLSATLACSASEIESNLSATLKYSSSLLPYIPCVYPLGWSMFVAEKPSGLMGRRSVTYGYGSDGQNLLIDPNKWYERNGDNKASPAVTSTPIYANNNNKVYNVPQTQPRKLMMPTADINAVSFDLYSIVFKSLTSHYFRVNQGLSGVPLVLGADARIDADGINHPNGTSKVVVLKNSDGVSIGTYTGNGTSSRTLTYPFRPAAILICPFDVAGNSGGELFIAKEVTNKLHVATECTYIGSDSNLTLTAMTASGCTLSTAVGGHYNRNGIVYYYVFWR